MRRMRSTMRSHGVFALLALWAPVSLVSADLLRIDGVSEECAIQPGRYNRVWTMNAFAQDLLVTPTAGYVCTDGNANYGVQTREYLVEFLPQLDAEQSKGLQQWQSVCDSVKGASIPNFKWEDHFLCPTVTQCSRPGDPNDVTCLVFDQPHMFSASRVLSMKDLMYHDPSLTGDLKSSFHSLREQAQRENRAFDEDLRKLYGFGQTKMEKTGILGMFSKGMAMKTTKEDGFKLYKERIPGQSNLFTIQQSTEIIYKALRRLEILSSLSIEHQVVLPRNIWIQFKPTDPKGNLQIEKVLLGGLGFTAIGDEQSAVSAHVSQNWSNYVFQDPVIPTGATRKMYSVGRIYLETLCGTEALAPGFINWNTGKGKAPVLDKKKKETNPCAKFLAISELEVVLKGLRTLMLRGTGHANKNPLWGFFFDAMKSAVDPVYPVQSKMQDIWDNDRSVQQAPACGCRANIGTAKAEKVCNLDRPAANKPPACRNFGPFKDVASQQMDKTDGTCYFAPFSNSCSASGPSCQCIDGNGIPVEDGDPSCQTCVPAPDASYVEILMDQKSDIKTFQFNGKFKINGGKAKDTFDKERRFLWFAAHLAEKLMRPDLADRTSIPEWSAAANLQQSYEKLRRKPIFATLDFQMREMWAPKGPNDHAQNDNYTKKLVLNWNVYKPADRLPPLRTEMEHFDVELWPQLEVNEHEDIPISALSGDWVTTDHISTIYWEMKTPSPDDEQRAAFKDYKDWLSVWNLALWPFKFEGNECTPTMKKPSDVYVGGGGLDQALERSEDYRDEKSKSKSQKKSKSKSKSKSKKVSSRQSDDDDDDDDAKSSQKKSSSKKNRSQALKQAPNGVEGLVQNLGSNGMSYVNGASGLNASGPDQYGMNHFNLKQSDYQPSHVPQGEGIVPPSSGGFYAAMLNAQQ